MYRKRRERNKKIHDVGPEMFTGVFFLLAVLVVVVDVVVVVVLVVEPWCPPVLWQILWDGHCTQSFLKAS